MTSTPSPSNTQPPRAPDFAEWRKLAGALSFQNLAFINGEFVPAKSGRMFPSVNPATGDTLVEVAECDAADVDRAVAAARRAFDSGEWAKMHPARRGRRLRRLADLIMRERETFALLDSLDMGKPISDAWGLDVPGAAGIFRYYGEAADKVCGEIAPSDADATALISREQIGVVGAVVPWNYPLDMLSWKCAPALAAGCCVVLKPAEQSPLSALLFAELTVEAGLPPGVFNVVPGFGETAGAAIGRHMGIDCVAFTGSTQVGKMFLTYAGESGIRPVWLECGGKSPNLVFADADNFERAAEESAAGIFFNQGEVCSANSRLLVERNIRGDFVAAVAARGGGLAAGGSAGSGDDDGRHCGRSAAAPDRGLRCAREGGGREGGLRRGGGDSERAGMVLSADDIGGGAGGDVGCAGGDIWAGAVGFGVWRRGGGGSDGQRHNLRLGGLHLDGELVARPPPGAGAAGGDGVGEQGGRF